jgi:YD repeat-containing protein
VNASTNLICSKTAQATTDTTGSQGFSATATTDAPMTWSYTYNLNGQILTMDGPRTDVSDVTTYSYYTTNDPSGNYRTGDLASVANALGQVTQFSQYDGNGHLLLSVDPNGLQTIRTYDSRSRLTSQKVGTAVAGYEVTQYEYDEANNLTKVTLPDSSFVVYGYDDAHRMTQMQDGLGNTLVYTLDAMGNRTAETANDVHGALARKHTRVVDALNRIAQDIGGTNPATQVTANTYDANNNLLTTTDPLTHQTTQIYDARNRLVQVQDPLNGSAAPTVYGYNGLDQLVSVTDPKSHTTTYALNGYGEVLTLMSPDTGVTTYTYDAASNLTKKIDARGDPAGKALYSYDALNRATTISYADETVTYAYDSCTNGIGRLCSITDKSGSTAYTYDVKGRITSKSETITLAVGSSKTLTVSYSYNAAGQLQGMQTAGGRQIGYSYTNNRPTTVLVNSTAVLTGATYEPFGPNSGWTWGNGDQHFRVPDLDFRPSVIQSETASSTSYFSRTYSYDGANNILGITDGLTASLNSTQTYDSLNRLGSFTQNSTARNYTYDGVGNRLTDNLETYTYLPTSNRLSSATGSQSFSYSYDLVGNQLSNGQGAWTFGGNNRAQTGQSTATGQSATFLVNALGQRVMKSNGSGVKTLFVYDEAGHLIGEYDSNGTPLSEHVWLGDLPIAVLK